MTRFELILCCGFYVYIMFMIGAFNWSLVYWSYWFDPDVIQWTWDQWVMSLYSKMEIARLLVMQPGPVAMAVLLNISPPGPGISQRAAAARTQTVSSIFKAGPGIKGPGYKLQASSCKLDNYSVKDYIGYYENKNSIWHYRRQPLQAFQDARLVNWFTCEGMQDRRKAAAGEGQRLLWLLCNEGLLRFQSGAGCTVSKTEGH